MNTKMPVRPKMDSRIALTLPEDEKRRLFERAARQRIPAAELIRNALKAELSKPAAA